MSRIAKQPVKLPDGVEFKVDSGKVSIKGAKGSLDLDLNPVLELEHKDAEVTVRTTSEERFAVAMAGTTRALLQNMVTGVSAGFERRLLLRGVGYRANIQGSQLNLTLGFSHPVVYAVPSDVSIETPTQTEILIRGIDKQRVGQVAAEIRAYRPPEPYKGKGVRYDDERVIIKEAKKK